MSFSVILFGADPPKLRKKLASDAAMLAEIAKRQRRRETPRRQIEELCARVGEVRLLDWPAPGDELSFDAFLSMLDYAAERIEVGRLQSVHYSSDADEVPLLAEMTADPGPLPVPDVRGLECEIGYLPPERLRELAEHGPPPCETSYLDVGEELIEVFQSLADDHLGLYTLVSGAKITRGRRSRPPVVRGPSMKQLHDAVRTVFANFPEVEEEDSGEPRAKVKRELFDAAEEGRVRKVQALLKKGADVNAKRGDGYTPFLLALGEGHNEVCRMLLDAGARVDAILDDGSSAMHIAASIGNLEGLEIVHRLGVPIDGRDRLGCTALFEAATLEAAEWLLQHGADVNARDKYGSTALHQA